MNWKVVPFADETYYIWKSHLFFSFSNINEVCIWRTWRVCIQVELVTGGLSPVCASCFTTSRPPSFVTPSSVLGHHRRRRYFRPIWALTILYDAERPRIFARAPQLWRRSAYHRNIILTNFKFTPLCLFTLRFSHSVLWTAICFLSSCVSAWSFREFIFDYWFKLLI